MRLQSKKELSIADYCNFLVAANSVRELEGETAYLNSDVFLQKIQWGIMIGQNLCGQDAKIDNFL